MNPSSSLRRLLAVVSACVVVTVGASRASALTYTVNQLISDGTLSATVTGTIDVGLGDYTLTDGGTPFSSVNLLLTIGSSTYELNAAGVTGDGTGQLFVSATSEFLTLNATPSVELHFFKFGDFGAYQIIHGSTTEQMVIGSDFVSAAVTLPMVLGTVPSGVPDGSATVLLLGSALAALACIRRRNTGRRI